MSQSLAVSNAEILRAIAVVAGFNRDAGEWDATQLADCRAIIRSGLRRFLHPAPVDGVYHQWRFLERAFQTVGVAVQSTGTVTVTAGGLVVLAGATWPTWAVDGLLRIDGRSFLVNARTTAIELVIDHDAITYPAGTEYELYRIRYALPSDFTEFIGQLVYDKGDGNGKMVRLVDEAEIRLRTASQFRTGDTCMAAVSNARVDDTDAYYLSVWPVANENATLAGVYRRTPLDNLDSADLTADGSVVQVEACHAETLISAIQAAAEEFYKDAPGVHSVRFEERLRASLKIDQYSRGPQHTTLPKGVDPWKYAMLYHTPDYSGALL